MIEGFYIFAIRKFKLIRLGGKLISMIEEDKIRKRELEGLADYTQLKRFHQELKAAGNTEARVRNMQILILSPQPIID